MTPSWTATELIERGFDADAHNPRQVRATLAATGIVRCRLPLDHPDTFAAFAARLGTPLPQSASGERLLEVRDHGYAPDDPRFRGPHSSRRLSFHTDRCDAIAFACVRSAAEGGDNHVLSSAALYARIRAADPRAAQVLEQPFPYRRHSVDPHNPRPWITQPVFSHHGGRLAASFLRVLIDRAHAAGDCPDLSAEQVDALDLLESLADDPELYVRIRLEPGQVLLLDNWVTMHRRTAFVDDPKHPRLLWRVWLSMPDSHAIDPRYADHFGATEAGALRGGIWPSGQAPWSG